MTKNAPYILDMNQRTVSWFIRSCNLRLIRNGQPLAAYELIPGCLGKRNTKQRYRVVSACRHKVVCYLMFVFCICERSKILKSLVKRVVLPNVCCGLVFKEDADRIIRAACERLPLRILNLQGLQKQIQRGRMGIVYKLVVVFIVHIGNPVHITNNIQAAVCIVFIPLRNRKVRRVGDRRLPSNGASTGARIEIWTHRVFLHVILRRLRHIMRKISRRREAAQLCGIVERDRLPCRDSLRERRLVGDHVFIGFVGIRFV